MDEKTTVFGYQCDDCSFSGPQEDSYEEASKDAEGHKNHTGHQNGSVLTFQM